MILRQRYVPYNLVCQPGDNGHRERIWIHSIVLFTIVILFLGLVGASAQSGPGKVTKGYG